MRPAARPDVAGPDLGLLDLHVRIERDPEQVVGAVAADDGVLPDPPVIGHPNLVHRAAGYDQRRHPVGDQDPCLDRGARGDQRGPAVGLEPALGRQLRRHLAEHLRLQFGQIRQPPAHPARGVVLGQPVGGEHVRVHVGAGRARARRAQVVRPREDDPGRALLLRVKRVGDWRLLRLVVRGERAVDHPLGGEQPGLAVGLHDEGVVSRQRRGPAEIRVRAAAGGAVDHEVGHVVTDPASLRLVPPDVLLPFAPRFAVRVGRRPVVEDPPVGRPRPAPFRLAPPLAAVRHAVGRVVHAPGVHPGVDPAPGRRRSVGAQRGVGGKQVAGLRAG